MTDGILTLQLTAASDILAALGKIKRTDQFIICFALETADGKEKAENAVRKLKEKNADYVVLNTAESIRSDFSTVQIFDRSGNLCSAINGSKSSAAEKILEFVLRQEHFCIG
jgi:phosphopantothenoylcysteine decarboxylase/phosphopantothenate--cysteine ligase